MRLARCLTCGRPLRRTGLIRCAPSPTHALRPPPLSSTPQGRTWPLLKRSSDTCHGGLPTSGGYKSHEFSLRYRIWTRTLNAPNFWSPAMKHAGMGAT